MIDNVSLKFAVSALALGTTMVACKPATSSFRPATASTSVARSDQRVDRVEAGLLRQRSQDRGRNDGVGDAMPFDELD